MVNHNKNLLTKMTRITKAKIDQWCADYDRVRMDYVRYTKKIESLLDDILSSRNISYHLIEARTKDATSLREKITRGSKVYANPLEEITDFSGLRIITYYQDDALLIADAIKFEFDVDVENSVEHSPVDAEFGYRSAHYIVRLKESRTELVEWAGLAGLRAEIQVRTVLQHAWAAISHKLQYKRENDVPAQLRRKLFRLSALFELADDEFVSLRDASGRLVEEIDLQLAIGVRDIPIDHLSLSQFIEKSPTVVKLDGLAEEAGFKFDEVQFGNTRSDSSISDLVQLVGLSKITTLSQLEGILEDSLHWADQYFKDQFNDHFRKEMQDWYVTSAFVCALLVIRSEIKHLRPVNLHQLGWHREIASRVFRIAKSFSPSASAKTA